MQRTDAELVTAWLAGDQQAFADIYERYADALYGVCAGLLRDRAAAADVVHDTFVRAAARIGQLRRPERLRAWLFAIARNEVTNRHRAQARIHHDEDLETMPDDLPDPSVDLARGEAAELVWAAAESLQPRDREVLELNVRGGLDGVDLADALGVTPAHVYVLLSRLRDRMDRALGSLLVARAGRRECDDLARLLGDWDGLFTLAVRSRVTRHIEGCDTCRRRRAVLASPSSLLAGAVPLVLAAPAGLRQRVLTSVGAVDGTGAPSPSPADPAAPTTDPEAWQWRADGFPVVEPLLDPLDDAVDDAPDDVPDDGPTEPAETAVTGSEGGETRGSSRRTRLLVAATILIVALVAGVAGLALARDEAEDVQLSADMSESPTSADPGPGPAARASGGSTSAPSGSSTSSGADPAGASDPTAIAGGPTQPGGSPSTVGTPGGLGGGDGSDGGPTPGSAGPPEPAPAAAELAVDGGPVQFGADATSATLRVRNPGGETVAWTATSPQLALTIRPAGGALAPGGSSTVVIELDRAGLAEGALASSVTFDATRLSPVDVPVTGSVEHPPEIVRVAVAPVEVRVAGGAGCSPVTASVRVAARDESGPLSAEVRWSPVATSATDPVVTPLEADSGGGLVGAVGPFRSPGRATLVVTVIDARGNRATTDAAVTVRPCP